MTNEKKILELFSNLAILFKLKIPENDATAFKAAYQSINIQAIDAHYRFPLTQSFSIDFDSFLKTVLDNLSRENMNLSFVDAEEADIGIVIHYSDLGYGMLDVSKDKLYRINGTLLEEEPDTSQYLVMREDFRKKPGKYIKQQTNAVPSEVVSFKMKDVITYLFVNFSELSRIPDLQAFNITFEILQYKNIANTECQECYHLNENRLSIGARLSYSFLDNGTLAAGKLPLYNIGTLHP